MSPRRPSYFLLEPLAIVFAFMAGALLLIHSFTKRTVSRSAAPPSGPGNDLLRTYWPLLLAGAGGLAIVTVVIAAPAASATVFPPAIFALLALGVAMSIRKTTLRK